MLVDLGEFAVGAGEADLESFDFAEPSFAFEQGWLGEVAAIETTMAATARKLEAMRAGRSATVHLGMPDIRAAMGRSSQG